MTEYNRIQVEYREYSTVQYREYSTGGVQGAEQEQDQEAARDRGKDRDR